MEALLQGAAKGVLERGEKLGINQAVRDAMVEIRRNVQEARTSIKAGRDLLGEPGSSTTVRAVAMLDRRNRRLAALLDEPLTSLKSLASSDLEDKRKCLDALEIAAAKIQFIKIYLDDSTLDLPDEEEPVSSIPSDTPTGGNEKLDPDPLSQAVAAISLDAPAQAIYPQNPENTKPLSIKSSLPDPDKINIDNDPLGSGAPAASIVEKKLERPQPPIPTRSTLAQSSFSWMLEPDAAPSSSSPSIFPSNLPPIESSHRKRPSANASRERTAFLFGEIAADETGNAVLPGDIFGMEEIRKGKS